MKINLNFELDFQEEKNRKGMRRFVKVNNDVYGIQSNEQTKMYTAFRNDFEFVTMKSFEKAKVFLIKTIETKLLNEVFIK